MSQISVDTFHQEFPILKNQFDRDPLLKRYLETTLPSGMAPEIAPSLQEMGALAAGEMLEYAKDAESNPPRHVPYDPWGRKVDHLILAEGWKKIEAIAARSGVVASGYERAYGEHSRVYQMSLLYLFHPSSAFVSCPLAMTDGAARAIELYGDGEMKARAFKNLTSRDPLQFWTSGQWMTEKSGGSDVSGTQTQAVKLSLPHAKGSNYELHGMKWFTSATSSQMAMTLARIQGAEAGSRGLSLFYLETRNSQGGLNNINIHRLKDKMGTKALPTAELTLHGTPAKLVGGEGHGVRKISSLFNITRIYNAVCSLGQMRRAVELAIEYAKLRRAFGASLIDHPLHRMTLMKMQTQWAGCFHLTMRTSELLGRDECVKATQEESSLLRTLTPLAKLYCGKAVVSVCSEALECFGGAGYVEDTGLPRLLRDAQTLAIWEGTTNVLSLDLLRAFEKENGASALQMEFTRILSSLENETWRNAIESSLRQWRAQFQTLVGGDAQLLIANARGLAMSLTEIYIAALMGHFAERTQHSSDFEFAKIWMELFLPNWKAQMSVPDKSLFS